MERKNAEIFTSAYGSGQYFPDSYLQKLKSNWAFIFVNNENCVFKQDATISNDLLQGCCVTSHGTGIPTNMATYSLSH